MKINNNNNYTNILKSLQKTKQKLSTKKEDNKLETSHKKSVEITFSEEAKKLAEISKNEVHAARVEEIKKAIANNTYAIEPDAIAKGILDTIKGQKGME